MKKVFSLFLVLTLIFSLMLTSCTQQGAPSTSDTSSSSKDTSSKDTSSKDTSSKDTSSDTDTGLKVSAPGVLPIVEEKIEMRFMMPYNSYVTDYEDNKLTKYFEEQTNVHILFDLLPETEATDKLNLLLSSGADLPDVFLDCEMTNESLVVYGSQGLFIPLNDLIEEHGYYLRELFEFDPAVKPQITAPDGNIYALPDYGMCFNCDYAQRFWINKTFADALDLDVPKTTDDLYEFLKAIKTGDPNGNGKADEIPLVGAKPRAAWYEHVDGFLMNAFIYNDSDRRTIIDESGTVDVAFNKPEWREGLRYMHKLCSEGLLDPSSFTNDKETLRSIVEYEDAALVGSIPGGGYHDFSNPTGERRKDFMIIPPLVGPEGVQLAFFDKYSKVSNGQYMISRDCKYPEVAIKWGDFSMSDEIHVRGRYGEPGVDWVKPEEGAVAVNGGQAQYREILRWGTPQQSHWGPSGPRWTRFGSDAREKDPDDPYELEYVLYEGAVMYVPYAPEYITPKFFFTPDEAREYTDLFNTIRDYVEEMIARFTTGDADIETGWDTYLKELETIGVDRYIEIMQTAFERQWRESW